MNRWPATLAAVLALTLLTAGEGPARPGDGMDNPDEVTVITSEKLTFDYKQQYALFEENVLVLDPQMKMTCDKLVVWFDEGGQAKMIKSEGNVQITQEDKVAEAGEATYDLRKAKIVLTKSPRLRQGQNFMEGTVITYHVDSEVVVCEPQAKAVFFPDGDGASKNPFADR